MVTRVNVVNMWQKTNKSGTKPICCVMLLLAHRSLSPGGCFAIKELEKPKMSCSFYFIHFRHLNTKTKWRSCAGFKRQTSKCKKCFKITRCWLQPVRLNSKKNHTKKKNGFTNLIYNGHRSVFNSAIVRYSANIGSWTQRITSLYKKELQSVECNQERIFTHTSVKLQKTHHSQTVMIIPEINFLKKQWNVLWYRNNLWWYVFYIINIYVYVLFWQ